MENKIKYQLHKIPEGFIITVSDNYVEDNQLRYNPYTKDLFLYEKDKVKQGIMFPLLGSLNVIAQEHQIDFSVLSYEEQKRIGWYTQIIRNSAFEHANKYGKENCGHKLIMAYIDGFQKAQDLLSDKQFTLEDIRLAFNNGYSQFNVRNMDCEDYIESLSETSWEVEVEMEEKSNEDIQKELGIFGHDEGLSEREYTEYSKNNFILKPEFTNSNMKVVMTVEETLKNHLEIDEYGHIIWRQGAVKQAMVEFGKYHVEKALNSAIINHWLKYHISTMYNHEGKINAIENAKILEDIKKSILGSYDLKRIK
jgi:hypothetical protein